VKILCDRIFELRFSGCLLRVAGCRWIRCLSKSEIPLNRPEWSIETEFLRLLQAINLLEVSDQRLFYAECHSGHGAAKVPTSLCGSLDSLFEGKGTHLGRSEREDIPGKREIGGDQIGYCRHHELQRVLAGKRSYLNSNVTKPQRMISPF